MKVKIVLSRQDIVNLICKWAEENGHCDTAKEEGWTDWKYPNRDWKDFEVTFYTKPKPVEKKPYEAGDWKDEDLTSVENSV